MMSVAISVLLVVLLLAETPAAVFAAVQEGGTAENGLSTEVTEVNKASSMEDLANASSEVKDEVDATSEYGYKSLILDESYSEEIQTYGADEALYYDGIYLLKYDSEESAQTAHEALIDEYGAGHVVPNIPLQINDKKNVYGWGTYRMNMNYEQTVASSGEDVTVAVIDTGINESHEVFNGREIVDAYDFVNGIEGSAVDDNGHGTAVCGIIAESTPNNVKIMPLKALDEDGYCDTITMIAAIEHAEEKGADIINMSLGGYVGSKREMNLLERIMRDYKPLMICAAGNDNENMDAEGVYEFPGELTSTICVGSINKNDIRSSFSNYGTALDFVAPGENLKLAYYGGGYAMSSGTSFSSPYVAAAAALIKIKNSVSDNDGMKSALVRISSDLGDPGKDKYYGNGCPVFVKSDNDGTVFINTPIHIDPEVEVNPSAYVYTGNPVTPGITVRYGTTDLINGTDYDIIYNTNRTYAGTHSLLIKLKGNFTGFKTVNFKINKAANTITTAAKKAGTVKRSKLRRKAQTVAISKLATIRNAQGRLTYAKVSGSKKLSINKSTGKVTVKKKTKKGKYKMKIKVTAAGNTNYHAASRYVTVTVKVK